MKVQGGVSNVGQMSEDTRPAPGGGMVSHNHHYVKVLRNSLLRSWL